jgi:type II secretory pathway component GspD/PulD (secretin)
MNMTKLTWAMAGVLTLAFLGSGAGVATYGLAGDGPPAAVDKQNEPPVKPAVAATPSVSDKSSVSNDASKHPTDSFTAYCRALQQPASLERPIQQSALRDVLDFLSDKFGTTFIVDTQAFEAAGVGGGRNVEDTQVNLPKMPGVTLATVLRFLVGQIDGAYLIRRDYIEITTRNRQVVEAFGPSEGASPDNLTPAVNVVFSNRPLENALADLAAQTGKNVVLDPRVQDKEKLVVSARLLNTPIDSAVLVVADMVGLQPVTIGNVFYITTKPNADRLHKLRGE